VRAEFGDDPTRYSDAKARKPYAGTAPIRRLRKHELVGEQRPTPQGFTWWVRLGDR